MKRSVYAIAISALVAGAALAASDVPLNNWAVPARGGSGIRTLGESSPTPFIGLTPCRIVDTRGGAPLTGGYMPASTPRSYALAGQCGVPSGATAISINVTVANTGGAGYVSVWPQGGSQPVVSTLNYTAGTVIANAAVVPIGTASGVTFACMNAGCDLIVDTNGYYGQTPAAGTSGLYLFVNNPGYAILGENFSTACGGPCGVRGISDSNANGTNGVEGDANSSTGYNFGVVGVASGVGGYFSAAAGPSGYSAGVYGIAMATTGRVAGVYGSTGSSSQEAAGVVGTANIGTADAGLFFNSGFPVYTHIAVGHYGLITNGDISVGAVGGTALYISGLPKNFVAPDPVDPSREIVYAAIEGPSADVFFRGTAHLVNGAALIQVPEHFRHTAREDSYMTTATAVGARSTLWVESEGPDGIVVRGAGDAAFHYVVYAERDETRDQQPVRANVHFTPEALVGKAGILSSLPERTRALLVKNGILNSDFTINTQTAERYGWKVPRSDEAPATRQAPAPDGPAEPAPVEIAKP